MAAGITLDTRAGGVVGEELDKRVSSLRRVSEDPSIQLVHIALVVLVVVQVDLLGGKHWSQVVVWVGQVCESEDGSLVLRQMLLFDAAIEKPET